jgi:hypothetical protein
VDTSVGNVKALLSAWELAGKGWQCSSWRGMIHRSIEDGRMLQAHGTFSAAFSKPAGITATTAFPKASLSFHVLVREK